MNVDSELGRLRALNTAKEAARAMRRKGEHVRLAGGRSKARATATIASGGNKPIREAAHPDRITGSSKGRSAHYHLTDAAGRRLKGSEHVKALYSVGSALTVAHYAQSHGRAVELSAAVIDSFNPLSLIEDAAGVADFLSEVGAAGIDAFYGVEEEPAGDAP